ncbi:Uncharacterised protein [uncultured archaeon]|nr:Uncharacterised protein [uncultured archaeon]
MKAVSTVNIILNNPEKKKLEFPAGTILPGGIINWQALIFVNKKDGTPVSLDFIWSHISKKIYSDIPEDGSKIHFQKIKLDISNLQVLTNSGPVDVISIEFLDADLWI